MSPASSLGLVLLSDQRSGWHAEHGIAANKSRAAIWCPMSAFATSVTAADGDDGGYQTYIPSPDSGPTSATSALQTLWQS